MNLEENIVMEETDISGNDISNNTIPKCQKALIPCIMGLTIVSMKLGLKIQKKRMKKQNNNENKIKVGTFSYISKKIRI